MREQEKALRKEKTFRDMLGGKHQNKTADKCDNTTRRNKSKDIDERGET